MVLNRSVVVGMGLAAGAAAAVALYATAADSSGTEQAVQVTSPLAPLVQPTTPEPTVSYSPCTPPAELEDGVCVTHKVVTKVVSATSEAQADARGAASVRESQSTSPRHTTDTSTSTREGDATEVQEEGDHEDGDHQAGDHRDDGDVDHGDD